MGLFGRTRRTSTWRAVKTVKVLHRTPWRSLYSVSAPRFNGREYVYLHETYCDGQVVAVLPFRRSAYGWQFLLRQEIVPCWDIDAPALCALTGASSEANKAVDAVRELHEETGFRTTTANLVPLGLSRGTKAADTVYTLFAVDLTGAVPGPLRPDSQIEGEGTAVWVTVNQLANVTDPQAHVMYMRLLPLLIEMR